MENEWDKAWSAVDAKLDATSREDDELIAEAKAYFASPARDAEGLRIYRERIEATTAHRKAVRELYMITHELMQAAIESGDESHLRAARDAIKELAN